MEVEIVPARIAPQHQRSGRQQGGAADQKGREIVQRCDRESRDGDHGTSRRVCLVDAVTAPSVKGMAKVLPLYQ